MITLDSWLKLGLALPFFGTAAIYFLAPSELSAVHLILLMIATFGAIAFALVFYFVLFNWLSPRNQLVFSQFEYLETPKKKGSQLIIKYIQPALPIFNGSIFPISYIVESFDVTVEGGHVPDDARRTINSGSTIPSKHAVRFKLPWVDIEGLSLPRKAGEQTVHYGTTKVKLRYGRPAKERFNWEISTVMVMTFARAINKSISLRIEWYNDGQKAAIK
jgi:hypothetical protein